MNLLCMGNWLIWLSVIFSSTLIIVSEGYLFYLFTAYVNELKSEGSWISLLCKYRATADITDELRNVIIYRRKNNTVEIPTGYPEAINEFSDSLLRRRGVNPLTREKYPYGTGFAFTLMKAYHSRPVENRNYYWMFRFADQLRRLELSLKEDLQYRDSLFEFNRKCNRSLFLKESIPFHPKVPNEKVDRYNFIYDSYVTEDACIYSRNQRIFETKSQEELIISVYRDSSFLFCSYAELSVDFEKFGVNGRETHGANVSSIVRQYYESKQLTEDIIKHFKELSALKSQAESQDNESEAAKYYTAELQRFNTTFSTDPIKTLVADKAEWATRRIEVIRWLLAYRAGCKPFLDIYRTGKYNTLEGVLEDLDDIFDNVTKTVVYYDASLSVHELREPSENLHETWDWDISKPMHAIRVAWSLLDMVNEDLKCVLHKSYWQDIRNETLKKTQLDLTKTAIYSQISKTLYQPCKTTDTDLIGSCTKENHEICRPMIPSRHQQRYLNNEEDFSIYKPKWVFTRRSAGHGQYDLTCDPLKTYVIGVNLCQCGYVGDCARDLGKPLNCPLQDVGDLRQQCKGSIGYPCKSLPLAPGRYDESCVTGYCHMRLNSCEDDTKIYPAVHLNNKKEDLSDPAILKGK